MWLGNIAMWNQYTDSTGDSNLYMKQRQNMTWTKYQSKMIISHCSMGHGPKQSITGGTLYYQWNYLSLGAPLNNSNRGFIRPSASYFSYYLDSLFRIKFNIF